MIKMGLRFHIFAVVINAGINLFELFIFKIPLTIITTLIETYEYVLTKHLWSMSDPPGPSFGRKLFREISLQVYQISSQRSRNENLLNVNLVL